MNKRTYFLPYQEAWLKDESMLKIWEKTRRGGMTYVQSYEDVRDAVAGKWDVWFSSADDTAAKEYIRYCEQWTRLFKEAARPLQEEVISESGKPIQTYRITFKSGKRITALSSNPNQFRSKGGKVVLDEFAHHKNASVMWEAAEPVTTWGFPLRILSTHFGVSSRFNRLIEAARKGKLNASVHRTDILSAIDEGLLDKIFRRRTTTAEREEWIEDKQSRIGSAAWRQEYLAMPADEQGALLTYELIDKCSEDDTLKSLAEITNFFYVGMDIARRANLSVIWVAEKIDRRLYTRIVKPFRDVRFSEQYEELKRYLSHPLCMRACLDMTGIGEQLTEEAQEDFGKWKVEGVRFSNASKEAMAYQLLTMMEDRNFILPDSPAIREDFHSIEKETTAANNVRLKATKNESDEDSHADYFWSGALCNHAAYTSASGAAFIRSAGKRKSNPLTQNFNQL